MEQLRANIHLGVSSRQRNMCFVFEIIKDRPVSNPGFQSSHKYNKRVNKIRYHFVGSRSYVRFRRLRSNVSNDA